VRTRIQTAIHVGYDKFFRIKLLVSDSDEILKYVEELENEGKEIRNQILKFCWHMRGGLSYNEGMALSYTEREQIAQLIKENLETTKKSGLPYF